MKESVSEHLARVAQRTGWLAYNVRWVVLVTAALYLSAAPAATGVLVVGLLATAALANFTFSLFEVRSSHLTWLPWASLAVDFILGLALYFATGGPGGRLAWIGLLPGLTVALRLGSGPALATTLAFLLLQAGLGWLADPADARAVALPMAAAVLMLPTVAAAGLLAERLRAFVRTSVGEEQAQETWRTQILRQHARAIYEMSSMVSATLNYREVLEAALDFGARGAEGGQPATPALVSAVLFFEDDQLHLASSRRLTTADQRVVCPGRAGVLGEVIRTGEPSLIADPARDPELQQFASFQACRSLMALPLRAGYETYGVLVYGHPRPDFFDADQRALMVAIANQAIVALQNAQLYRSLREEKQRLIEVQEEGQKKLARDLHDGPTQAVAALAMRANFVRRLLERDPKAAGEELFKMEDLARRTTKEIRHMLFTLRPLVLESQGLSAALQQLADKMKETHGQHVRVEAEAGVEQRLELNQSGVLFYIVEEAVSNARKHAQAQHIWVRLKTDADTLVVEVQDDGVGFNIGSVDANYDRRGSLGMVNMRERVEMIGGAVNIDTAEGRGTRITVYVPLLAAAPAG